MDRSLLILLFLSMAFSRQTPLRVCRKNEFLCANSVMLGVSVVKLPGKTFTTEARSLHREPRRTFSDRLLRRVVFQEPPKGGTPNTCLCQPFSFLIASVRTGTASKRSPT